MDTFLNKIEVEKYTGCYSRIGQAHWLRHNNIEHLVNSDGDVLLARGCLDIIKEEKWREKIFLSKVDVLKCTKIPRRGVGIYFLRKRSVILYIGKTTNFFVRMAAHDKGEIPFDSVSFVPTSEMDLDLFEREYILKFKPKYDLHLTSNTASYMNSVFRKSAIA